MKKFALGSTRLGKALGGKGVYITLAACFVAVAGAGVFAYNKAVNKINDNLKFSLPDSSVGDNAQADNKQDDIAKEDSSLADNIDEMLNSQPNVMPVNGDVINPFSNGELVKSETLGVWKTHDGIDIKCDTGTQVKAMNKGTVTEIKNDALWGNCVIIDHGNGVEGHYYNLAKSITVIVGDEVDSGEIIGSVGDTAEIEIAEASHLHFGLKKNGEWIDPVTYINPSSSK